MKVCLAGSRSWVPVDVQKAYKPFILESFLSTSASTTELIRHFPFYMLDSGIFSFMTGVKQYTQAEFTKYVDKYIAYVVNNNIKLFFEMDADSLIGYKKVLDLRKYINREVGRDCIPVWHRSRGQHEFSKMCDEYSYVAIGGLAIQHIRRAEYRFLPPLISEAHKRRAKIHGLGFTNSLWLPKCHFDSVDSSSWLSGCLYGTLYTFNGSRTVRTKKENCRLKDTKAAHIHNFIEWVKFQRWADTHL